MTVDWQQLNPRERAMLLVAGLSLLIYGFYALVLAPLSQSLDQLGRQLVEKKATLAWMQRVSAQQKNQGKRQSVTTAQLLTLISDPSHQAALKPFVLEAEQLGGESVQVTAAKVPYTAVMAWLRQLTEQYRLSIQQLQVKKADAPGLVTFRLVLSPSS